MDQKRSNLEKKDEDDGGAVRFFQALDKGMVLQEKRIFNETPLNHRKCCNLLTQILYLVYQGEKFTKNEATDLFFACTKLFQSRDILLRRMLYLVLKELIPFMAGSPEVIIVMSSMTKDMNSKNDSHRGNAIRVLSEITDATLLGQVERYFKQAIVDKEPLVSSSAILAGVHLMTSCPEIIKRWVAEVQEATTSGKSAMAQYHALGLLYLIKQNDRLAVSKLVAQMIKTSMRSPHAQCLLIRYTVQVMEEDPNAAVERGFYNFLETCLRNKSEMVMFEAAKAICNLKQISSKEIAPALSVLQLFLSSPRAVLRFAAVRALSKVAQTHPASVATCNFDLENLITDSNRNIATLAITTLLKTGNETSVDKLLKQIASFMGEISDEFKIVVVDAVQTLVTKFPKKYRVLLSFLSGALRDEGGYEYKRTIVDSILGVIQQNPEAKEIGLTHLCEFIEDCDYNSLAIKILHLLGQEGPKTSIPSRYIRYIYNRISLESASVRAAAVSALAKFGSQLDNLRPSIISLLRRCTFDTDDEVRDRATFNLLLLEKADRAFGNNFILGEFNVNLANLERALQDYQKNPSTAAFDFSRVSALPVKAEVPSKKEAVSANKNPAVVAKETSAQVVASLPQFASYGKLWRSSFPVELTEKETEYVVNCTKHFFEDGHTVLQFNCANTLKEQILANVTVKLDISNVKGVKIDGLVPLSSLPCGTPGNTFVSLLRPQDSFPTGSIGCTLKFISKEIDPSTGEPEEPGYEDEYHLEELELGIADYMQRVYVENFQDKWQQIGDEFEVIETYALTSMKGLQDAVLELSKFLGMQPCDGSEKVVAKKTKHTLMLSGTFQGGIPVLAIIRMKTSEGVAGVQVEVTVRSTNDDVSTAVAGAI